MTPQQEAALEQAVQEPVNHTDMANKALREAMNRSAAVAKAAQGCDYCAHPEYAGTKCKNCGRVNEQPAIPQGIDPETRVKDGLKYSPNYVAGYNDGLKTAVKQSLTTEQPAIPHPACKPDMLVNGGALRLALNSLRRGTQSQIEIADELEKTAVPAAPTPQGE